MVIYTLGHSNHPPDKFIHLLHRHGIKMVADVRSRPYSRYCPHFNRDALRRLLEENGLRYLYLGKELGGKPRDLDRPQSEAVVWDYLRSRPQFREGLARLLTQARQVRVCLLCAEADPARCHRGQLLGPELMAQGAQVRHILADGTILQHQDLLIPREKPSQKRLF